MIPCQRHLFDIPVDVAYFNCAFTSPLLNAAKTAAQKALTTKAHPWTLGAADFFDSAEEARGLFARLIGASADDIALVPAVSYGIALAARNLPVDPGQHILVLQHQFPSNVYSWRRLARERGAEIRTVAQPEDHDWTRAVLAAMDEKTAIAALPQCHWTDGALLDLEQIGAACRAVGAALVVDGIQSLGAMVFDLARVQPDILVAASHKWLLGAYSCGFCYLAPKWQSGIPLEENWLNRAGSEDFSRLVDYRDGYQAGARRFDMGECSNFILTPVAAEGLRQILAWGVAEIAETLARYTHDIARRARDLGFQVPPPDQSAPHLIGITKPGGFKPDLPAQLAAQKVMVGVRGEAIRIAPHLYTSDADMQRLFRVMAAAA
ncbi:MAG: aminotransferase class V-fold PLP-dependent enzyme [Desulfobacterales bacterium]